MVTIKDVARMANVNPAIVSRLLNNDATLSIKEETKKRVFDAIEKLNYKPNSIARSLRTKKTNTLAAVIADIFNPYFTAILKGAQRAAQERGYTLMIFDTEESKDKEYEYIQLIHEKRVDGVVLMSVYTEDQIIQLLEGYGLPYALVQRAPLNISNTDLTIYVTSDDVKGARLAVNHLAQLGHKHIAHLSGPLYTQPGLLRLEGFRKGLRENNLQYDFNMVLECGYNEADGYSNMMLLLESGRIPTAVFAGNDLIAFGAMEAIRQKNLSIPEQISVFGFDDIWFARKSNPPLTTIRVELMQMGYQAVELLTKKLDGEKLETNNIFLDLDIVVRGSTGPVNENISTGD